MSKRTLNSFFSASPAHPTKKARQEEPKEEPISCFLEPNTFTEHPTYPWPVPELPDELANRLSVYAEKKGRAINDQAHLDLLYFEPFIPASAEHALFHFLRTELFFYRVRYKIQRFGKETDINTPRYTTVFGVDETSRFAVDPPRIVSSADPSKTVPKDKYKKCQPRPIPGCLETLRQITEKATNCTYNFCLVNYYATGADSISFHSDDERFLGPNPSIASFSLGAKRDFLMKHKPVAPKDGSAVPETKPIKLNLASGDMVLMRGETQANWLHSIPKRKGGDADKGRINITFRKAMVPGGTENYYR